MNKTRITLVAVLLASVGSWCCQAANRPSASADAAQQFGAPGRAEFSPRQNGQVVTAEGSVSRILADDRNGSRHQRFIIRTHSGSTLLIAHNIDLAPRLNGLAVGDQVLVAGEYEWNAQGGLLHWTHRDPAGRHRPGYIQWKGRRYE